MSFRFDHRFRLLACALLLAGNASAQSPGENVTHGYAQVLRASPVYTSQRVRVPGQRCEGDADRGRGGAIAGAVVGGVLGNRAGKGDGRKVATVAGAVLGGAIGRQVDRNNATGNCRPADAERVERRLVGYDVEYQYKGETYMSRLPSDPGNRLRVRVTVVPDDPAVAR
jgi:uncharacterized protein YcfJ